MKDSYKKEIQLQCNACGESQFEFNEDKSWVKCIRCGKEYQGGYDELVELNQSVINQVLEDAKTEILEDAKKDIKDMLRDAFKGSKNIKFKG